MEEEIRKITEEIGKLELSDQKVETNGKRMPPAVRSFIFRTVISKALQLTKNGNLSQEETEKIKNVELLTRELFSPTKTFFLSEIVERKVEIDEIFQFALEGNE